MEKRRRKDQVVDSAPEIKVKKPSSQVTFDAFFAKCVKEEKLKPWQRKEIAVFFEGSGLREKEDLELYEETLKKY